MNSSLKRAPRLWLGALLIGGVVVGCDSGSDPMTPPPPPPTPTIQSVVVTAAADSVLSGSTVQLSATVTNSDNQVVSNPTVMWSSSNASVAAVSASGLVTGQSEGSATITATVSGVSGSASMTVFIGSFEPTGNTTLSGAVEFTDVNVPSGVTVTVTDDLVLTARNSVTIDGDIVGDCVGLEINSAQDINVTGTVSGACSSGRPGGASAGALRLLAGGTWTLDDANVMSAGSMLISNAAADLAEAPVVAALASASAPANRMGDCLYRHANLIGGFTSPDPSGGPDVKLHPDVHVTCDGELFIEGGMITGGSGEDGADKSANGSAEAGSGESAGRLSLTGAHITVWKMPFTIKGGDGGHGGHASAGGTPPNGDANAVGGDGGNAWLPLFRTTAPNGGIFVGADAQLRVEAGRPGNGGDALATALDGVDASGSTPATAAGLAFALAGSGGEVGVADPTGGFSTTMFAGVNVQVLGATLVNPPALGNGGEATAFGGTGGSGGSGAPHGASGFIVQASGGNGGRYHVDLPGNAAVRQAGKGGDVNVLGGIGGAGFDGCTVGNIQDGGDGGPGALIEAQAGADGVDGPVTATVNLTTAGNGGAGGSGASPGAGGDAGVEVLPIPKRVDVASPNFTPGTTGGLCETAMVTDVQVKDDTANHEPTLQFTKLITAVSVLLGAQAALEITLVSLFTLTGSLTADLGIDANYTGVVAGFSNILVTLAAVLVVNEFNRVIGLNGVLTAGVNGGLFGVPVSYDVTSMVPAGSSGFDPAMFGLTVEQIEEGVASGKIIRQSGGTSR